MGIANVYDYDNWLLNPEIMEELYNRADEFINLLQDTGEYDESFDFTKALVSDVKGLKIGLPKEYFGEGINSS